MAFENVIRGINWHEQGAKIYDFTRKDASTYRTLGIIFGIASIIVTFFIPFVLMITLPLAFYMGYAYWKNSKGRPFACLVEIEKKECWYKEGSLVNGSYDTEGTDNSFYYYLLHVKIKSHWDIYKDRLVTSRQLSQTDLIIRLNRTLFGLFEEGNEAFFVFSPANDLLGYLQSNELVLLVQSVKNSNGSRSSISTSIPQELTYPLTGGFELLSSAP